MVVIVNDQPAFPIGSGDMRDPTGMTLRDYFAAKALPFLMSAYKDMDAIAGVAYKMADAMLKAREQE
jgi:hypothetical protein